MDRAPPTTAYGRPSNRSAVARSPARDRGPDVGADRTSRPSSVNGGTTTTSNPLVLDRARRAVAGVPARSWPNAASGVITKPARLDRSAIPRTKSSYGVFRSVSSKCSTTTSSTPASPRAARAARRDPSAAAAPRPEDRVRVGVERDHGRPAPRSRAPRATRCSSSQAWPRCRPSNTPTDDEQRSVRLLELERRRRGPSRTVARADSGGRRVDEDLVGRRASSRRAAPIATSSAGRVDEREAAASTASGPAAGRDAIDLAACDRAIGRVADGDRRQVEARRRSGGRSARRGRRPARAAAARMSSSEIASCEVERAARGPDQRAEVAPRCRRPRPGRGRAPGRTCPPSTRRRRSRSAARGRCRPSSTRSSAWISTRRGASSTVSPARAIA